MKTLEQLGCIIPEGWRRVTRGSVRKGDMAWSIHTNTFIVDGPVKALTHYNKVSLRYCVIRKERKKAT